MKTQHNISITALAGVFAVLGLASCEDKTDTANAEALEDEIREINERIEEQEVARKNQRGE